MFTFEHLDRPGSRVGRRRVHKAIFSIPMSDLLSYVIIVRYYFQKVQLIFVKINIKSIHLAEVMVRRLKRSYFEVSKCLMWKRPIGLLIHLYPINYMFFLPFFIAWIPGLGRCQKTEISSRIFTPFSPGGTPAFFLSLDIQNSIFHRVTVICDGHQQGSSEAEVWGFALLQQFICEASEVEETKQGCWCVCVCVCVYNVIKMSNIKQDRWCLGKRFTLLSKVSLRETQLSGASKTLAAFIDIMEIKIPVLFVLFVAEANYNIDAVYEARRPTWSK